MDCDGLMMIFLLFNKIITIKNTQSDFIFRVDPPDRRVDRSAISDRRLHRRNDLIREVCMQVGVLPADFYCLQTTVKTNYNKAHLKEEIKQSFFL